MIATARMFHTTAAVPGSPRMWGERPPAPLQLRAIVTPAELVARVNRRLAAHPHCAGLTVDAAPSFGARLPDADGCNWDVGALRVRMSHGPSTRALGGVRQVVEWARLAFALEEPGG